MSKLRDAAQQALEALLEVDNCTYINDYGDAALDTAYEREKTDAAITALRAALAEPEPRNQCGETCERAKLCAVCAGGLAEQEPVAWCDQYEGHIDGLRHYSDGGAREIPLYTAPNLVRAQTLEEVADMVSACDPRATPKGIAAAIRALKEQT